MSRRQTNKFISTKHSTKQWHPDLKLRLDIAITRIRIPDTLYSPMYAHQRAYAKRNRAVASRPWRTALGPPPTAIFDASVPRRNGASRCGCTKSAESSGSASRKTRNALGAASVLVSGPFRHCGGDVIGACSRLSRVWDESMVEIQWSEKTFRLLLRVRLWPLHRMAAKRSRFGRKPRAPTIYGRRMWGSSGRKRTWSG